jgi:hypothetical protein
MKRKLLSRHPSPAMVVALIALCSSLVAGATAATLITSKDIKRNAVRTKHVKNGSLLAKDFKRGQLAGSGAVAAKMNRGGARNFTNLNSSDRTKVVELTINAPASGFVALDYSATFSNNTPQTYLLVYLMEGSNRLNGEEWWEPGDAEPGQGNQDETQGNHLVVPVTKGQHTYELRLQMSAGTAIAHDARLSALFVPSSL